MNVAVRSIDKIVSGSRWATTIGEICDSHGGEIQTGPFGSQLHASDYTDDGTPVVMPRDMQDGTIVCDRIARIPQKHVERLRQHVLVDGDVVYSRRGDVTRFAVVTPREQGWLCGTGSIRIRLNCSDLEIGYVRQYLRQEAVGAWLEHNAKGVTMANLNTSIVRALPFVYPPLAEQRRIAEVLDRAEALRTKRRAALAQLDTLTQSIFLDLFGDPVSNPKGLRKQPLGQLIKFKSGDFLPASQMSAIGSFPVFGGNGINGFHDEFLFEEPQIIVGRVGAYCGCVHVSPPRSWITDNALYVSERSPDCELTYLKHALENAKLNQYASQSGQPLVSGSRIYPVQILVPALTSQQDFARRIAAVEKLKSSQRASLAELDALFASLQHRAFRGEL